ncbi:uncharacterized protein LOC128888092 [Hylaeus anthracinus]|uniref:uncharacterized protein LOC128888092 n=1 Tax=Hylaeus anthracinus TaxID=313031 RepID=UPI0023B9EA54|nr:uncharacterized protein LOC128888092 [Hylaeus anthracinus]
MKSSKASKVARDVQSAEDSEEDPITTTISAQPGKGKDTTVSTSSTKSSNQTIDRLSGYTIKVSIKTGGIVLISTILLTCCCTLFIRHRIANVFNRIFGRSKKTKSKKKGKYIAIDTDEPGYYVRKARPKRKREPSYELVDMGTQNTIAVVPKEPEEPPPTGCYKCYKKKRKKRPYR